MREPEIRGTHRLTTGIKLSKRPEKNDKGLEELLREMEKKLITNNLKA